MVDSEGTARITGDIINTAEEDNEFFKRVVGFISYSNDTEDDKAVDNKKSKDNNKADAETEKKRKALKRQRKEERKQARKKAKLDNEDQTSDNNVQTSAENDTFTKVKQKKVKSTITDDAEAVVNGVDDTLSTDTAAHIHKPSIPSKPKHKQKSKPQDSGGTRTATVTVNKQTVNKQSKSPSPSDTVDVSSVPSSSTDSGNVTDNIPQDPELAASLASIEDKRAKLRAKIAELQAKRNPTNTEKLDKKKLRRQESKMKLKQKRKLEKSKNKQAASASTPSKVNVNKNVTPAKPVYNKEGQLVFSKFDFTDSGKKEKKATDLHGKDYKRLLEKIEKRNERINQAKMKDESKGKALEEKLKWDSVLHKAEGEKVKDNPELLKKALKRKEKMKDQKKKKWENRVQQVEKMKDERIQKRNENIQKRKQTVKDKKMKKLKKKGRLIPGF